MNNDERLARQLGQLTNPLPDPVIYVAVQDNGYDGMELLGVAVTLERAKQVCAEHDAAALVWKTVPGISRLVWEPEERFGQVWVDKARSVIAQGGDEPTYYVERWELLS